MIEALGAAAEVSAGEIGIGTGESVLDFDSSKAMDFSNDSESFSFTTEKDGNKETEGQIKENFTSEQNKLDSSQSLDFSKAENSVETGQGEILDTSEVLDYSDNRGLDPLTEKNKTRLKEETGWSDTIIDAIGSKQEAEIYKNAGLVEAEIDGRPCLIRSDIDINQTDDYGRTNKERMEQGLAPLDSQGRPIELHHIGQKMDGPLAELTADEHRGNGNYGVLHDSTKESEINRTVFRGQKENHWQSRA